MKVAKENQTEVKSEENISLESLVEKAVAGDVDTLRILCERLAKNVLFRVKFILGKNVNEMDAEDVSQEIFLRICEKITNLRDPKAFGKWLNSIITNETNQFLRGRMKGGGNLNIDDYVESIVEERDDFTPEKYATNNDLRKTMMGIVSKLPKRQRQAIMLHYFDDFKVTEVAEIMNITHQGASQSLRGALDNITEELKKLPPAAILGVIPILSAESLLKETLQIEAMNFMPDNAGWLQNILAPCEQYFTTDSVLVAAKPAATATTASLLSAKTAVVTTIVTTVCCTLFVVALIVFNTSHTEEPSDSDSYIPMLDGDVIFSGGIDLGENYKRINPKSALPATQENIQILSWSIITENNQTVLQSDDVNDVENALTNLRENYGSGVYYIVFRVECKLGLVYRIGGSFLIE